MLTISYRIVRGEHDAATRQYERNVALEMVSEHTTRLVCVPKDQYLLAEVQLVICAAPVSLYLED